MSACAILQPRLTSWPAAIKGQAAVVRSRAAPGLRRAQAIFRRHFPYKMGLVTGLPFALFLSDAAGQLAYRLRSTLFDILQLYHSTAVTFRRDHEGETNNRIMSWIER